jgi:benzoate membrane transport protein
MALEAEKIRGWRPAITVSIRNYVIFVAVLSVPLAAAQELGLTEVQTTSWLLVIYGLSGILGLGLAIIFRQPLLMTGNLFALIFIASLGGNFSYPELIGSFIVAGAGVLIIGLLGLTGWISSWLPAPIVFGLLAGAIIPFVSRIFTFLGEAPILIGGTFLAYLLSRRFLETWVPAILPALLVGLGLTALTGQFGQLPSAGVPIPELTWPVFSLPAIATVSPVLIVLIIFQANLPSLVFMRNQGYRPPERVVDIVSGLGTILGSLLGPIGASLSLPATSLVAGAEAGERQFRYRAAYLSGGGLVVIGLLAGFAAKVPELIPQALLFTLAGLAVIGVLIDALKKIVQGPLVLGPMFAFAISLSEISLFGFGPFFWAPVIGTGISLLLEWDAMRKLREQDTN